MNNLPRELDKRRKKLSKIQKMDKLLKVKDDIIWNLILDKKKAKDDEITAINEKHIIELTDIKK